MKVSVYIFLTDTIVFADNTAPVVTMTASTTSVSSDPITVNLRVSEDVTFDQSKITTSNCAIGSTSTLQASHYTLTCTPQSIFNTVVITVGTGTFSDGVNTNAVATLSIESDLQCKYFPN